MAKEFCTGKSKGKTVECRLTMENVPEQSMAMPPTSGIERWQEGDTFSQVMQEYSFWSGKRGLTPRKVARYMKGPYRWG